MSKKNKVSSAKKSNKKSGKVVKPTKKNSASSPKAVKAKTKKVIKPVVKKKEAKKTAPKKNIVKTTKAKVVAKPISKKAVPAKKVAVKTPTKKIAAKTSKPVLKNPTPKVAIKKTEKIARPVATKKVEKTIPLTAKKETPVVKTIETTSKKAVKEIKPTNDVIAINNTIPVKKENEISLSKIASIASSITNPIKKTESYSVKPEKEPNGKFEMEFVVRASADLLYEFLYTQSGLSEWFCDDVNIRNGIYTFIWDGQMQQARLLKTIDHQLVRFQWVDKTDGSYFEFRLQHDDLTNDVSLMVTDFADTTAERESSKLLWQNQVEKLMHVIGSIY
ncbi:MAG: START-like domain-containing protein [Bacteroidota bacterium]|nr:START-like domain-containing protein [Bacteroidota bacterium]